MQQRGRLWSAGLMLVTTALLAITAAFGVSPQVANAAQSVPYLINFQGRLTDNSGNILTDGSYNIKFRMYDAATNGTVRWTGNRTYGATDNRITVTNGLFNIQFGDTAKGDDTLSPALFNSQTYASLYLEVELPTPATATCSSNGCASFTEGPMTPRQPLASSPYAFNSDTLDGLDATAFAQLTASNTFTGANLFAPTTASTVALTVKATTAGSTNALEVFNSAGTRQAYFDAAGALNVSQTIQPTTNNAVDLGTSTLGLRSAYFGTSVVTPALNVATSGGTLTTNVGTLSRTASGTTVVDLVDTGTTVLQVKNSSSGVANLNLFGGALTTGSAGTVRLTNAGVLSNITGLTLTSGSATFNQNAADLFKIAASAVPTTDMAQITNTGRPITTDGINAQQIDYYANLSTSTFQSSALRVNITNTSTVSGATTNALRVVATANVASNTNGIKIDNITSGAGTDSALNVGTGWDFILNSANTTLDSAGNLGLSSGGTLKFGGTTVCTSAGCTASGTPAGVIVQAPTSTATNTIAPTTASVVALTIKGTSSTTTANVLEVYNAGSTQSLQAYFNASGSLNVAQSIQPTANNAVSLGTSGLAWANVYSANFDTGTTTTALTLGATNAASITIGKAGLAVSMPGGLTTSGGSISLGAGNITTTGTINGQTISSAANFTGTIGAASDITLYQVGSTNSAPRTLSFGTNSASTAARVAFTAADGIQTGDARRLQLYGYSGIDIGGNRQASGAPGFVTGATTDPSLTVYGTTAAAPVQVIQGAASQSGDLLRLTNSTPTTLARFDSAGNLILANTSINTGSGAITTSGTITAGTFSGSGASLTNLNPSNLVTGSGAVTLQSAASTALNLTTTGTGAINVSAGTGGIVHNIASGVTSSYTTTGTQTVDMMTLQNTSALSSTLDGINLIQQTFYGKPASGNFQSSQRINVNNVNTAAGGQIQALRIVASGAGGTIASDTTGILIDSLTNASTGTVNENALEIGSGWDAGFYIQSGGNDIVATSTQALTVSNASSLMALTVDTSGNKVQIGSATTDANQILLQVDTYQASTTSVADTATCATTTNQGSLYYNSTTNAIRGCIGGAWEDVVSTAGLGIIAYGVIGDTGSNPGDIAGLSSGTANSTGPCKVTWTSSTSVTVQPCAVFSSGRKMVVPSAVTLSLTTFSTTNIWANVCMNPTTGAPYITTPGSSETTSGLPTFSIAAPVLCLAQIRASASTANAIVQIYDTRTFTNTQKIWATITTNIPSLGQIVVANGTTTTAVSQAGTGGSVSVVGVVVASSGSSSTTAPNGILATLGPQYVKATAGTAGGFATSSTGSAGYIISAGTLAISTFGPLKTTFANGCTSAATCGASVLVDLKTK